MLKVNAPIIAERQWPIDSRSSNGSPEVDYLKTTFKKFRNVGGWKMSMNPCDSRSSRLIYVNLRNWLSAIN